MKSTKKLGVWMDYSIAHMMDFTTNPLESRIIESEFAHKKNGNSLVKGESNMDEEHTLQTEYYKRIGEAIRNYTEVLLFGPTDAKSELLKILKSDPHYSKIKIEIRPADNMTEQQQHSFVRDYFLSGGNKEQWSHTEPSIRKALYWLSLTAKRV